MSAIKDMLEEDSFASRVEAVREKVLASLREYERLVFLIDRLGEDLHARPVEQLQEWLELPVRWPGQREKALAALAAHRDEAAAEVLEEWEPPEELETLYRVACSFRRHDEEEEDGVASWSGENGV